MDWQVLYELGSGGQGRTSVVKGVGTNDSLDQFIQLLIRITGPNPLRIPEAKEPFLKALNAVVRADLGHFVQKTLINPTEESVRRLALEAKVYERFRIRTF